MLNNKKIVWYIKALEYNLTIKATYIGKEKIPNYNINYNWVKKCKYKKVDQNF